MPIYVYECPSCFRLEELILPAAERDTPRDCPCGRRLQRLVTAGVFRMPGGNPKIDYEHAFNSDLYGKAEADAIKAGREQEAK